MYYVYFIYFDYKYLEHESYRCHIHTVSPTFVKFLKPAFETYVLKCEIFQDNKLSTEEP